jgi:hypothetical protein
MGYLTITNLANVVDKQELCDALCEDDEIVSLEVIKDLRSGRIVQKI